MAGCESEDSHCFADAEDEDEIAEAHRRLDEGSLQHILQQAQSRQQYRRRASVVTAGVRRPAGLGASGQAQRRQRRRHTINPPAAAGSFGAAADGFEDFEDAAQWPDAAHDIYVAALQAQLAAVEAELAAEREALEALAGSESEEEASRWSQRSERAEAAWREQAPVLGAAMLQVAAAPDPQQLCSRCNTQRGCTVRYVSCCYDDVRRQQQQQQQQQQQPSPSVLSRRGVIVRCSCCLQVLHLFTCCRVCAVV
jgi:hypothetical protein